MYQTPVRIRSAADLARVLHIFLLLDNSGSMAGKSLEALNEAMDNTLRALSAQSRKMGVSIVMHILSFSGGVKWLCGTSCTRGVSVHDIRWSDLTDETNTDTAGAIRAILPGLNRELIGHHTYPPIVILCTDGYSDNRNETIQAIHELAATNNVYRIAIGVDGYNLAELEDFVSRGVVKTMDHLSNELSRSEQGLIFPVSKAADLAPIVTQVSVSTVISSVTAARRTDVPEDQRIVIELPAQTPAARPKIDLTDDGWLK